MGIDPHWRTDPYDENYPTYRPSEKAREFIGKGSAMGYRVMPHFNAIDMDPTHPVYPRIRDFQYRTLETRDLWGWGWFEGKPMGVPESNAARLEHRDKKVMVKVHPGWPCGGRSWESRSPTRAGSWLSRAPSST